MHSLLLSLFSAVLLLFAFPGLSVPSLAWIAFVPFFFLITGTSLKRVTGFVYLSGLIFWAGLLYWITYVTWVGYVSLVLYLSLYFVAFAWLCGFLRYRLGLSFIWSAPVVWTSLEYVRTYLLTGFPWGLLGSSQYSFLPLIQIAEWTGVYGVSFLVMIGNAWLFEVLVAVLQKRPYLRFAEASFPLALLTTIFIYGGTFLQYPERPAAPQELTDANQPLEVFIPTVGPSQKKEEKKIQVALVQGNIPQDIKIDKEMEQYIQGEYRRLTLRALQEQKPNLVIWPETALPVYLRYDESALRYLAQLIRETQVPLLVGSSDIQKQDSQKGFEIENRNYFNSAFLIKPGKGLVEHYNKIHLVPFGEYVPWEWIPGLRKATPIEETYSPGRVFTVFDFDLPFSAVICFEDIFPNLVRQFVKAGAHWIVNMTNDGWFRESAAAMQHASLALFRCVENRVWMARCTNTGVTCLIDPYGQIQKQVEDAQGRNIWVTGSIAGEIGDQLKTTFYTRYGDVFCWLNCLAVIGMLVCCCRRKSV